jgi:Ran-binding protein 1
MRQEKTMKIIANHFLDPRISIAPNCGSDKSWVWIAYDFADNELVETTFAIRFASAEIAMEFKTAFTKAQEDNKQFVEGLDSKEGGAEADEAAAAIESLAVTSAADKEAEKADA